MKFTIDYDTLSYEVSVKGTNDMVLSNLQQVIADNQGQRITEWFGVFINSVKQISNNENFSIVVNGVDTYERIFLQELMESESDVEINYILNQLNVDVVNDKNKAVEEFIEVILNSKDPDISEAVEIHRENISNLKSNKVEIPVIATMSAGKSTLLNAIMGQNILPALNEATTATTCEIVVNNDLKSFKGLVFDGEEKKVEEKNIDYKFISTWNDKANLETALSIKIEGPVNNLNTHGFNLSFVDTPGPNNSQNSAHSTSIYTYIKDSKNLPIILFVLNSTQLKVDDEKNMLKEISSVIKKKGETLDRIIFVLNRVDQIKVNSKENHESIEGTIEGLVAYLNTYGIKNPKIFPISAEYAKLAQLDLDEDEDEDEWNDLSNFRRKMRPNLVKNKVGYQLVENSPLTNDKKQYLLNKAGSVEGDKDLVYSGLAGLKLYIEDYIRDHHQKDLINELYIISQSVYNTVISTIEKKRVDLEESSNQDKEKEKLLNRKEEEKIKVIHSSLKEVVNNLKIESNVFNEEKKRIIRVNNGLKAKVSGKNTVSIGEANNLLKEIKEELVNAEVGIATTINSTMVDFLNKRLGELKNISKNKFTFDSDSSNTKLFNSRLINSVTSFQSDVLNKYESIVREKKTRVVDKTFLGFKSILGFKVGEREESFFVDRKVVNIAEFYNKEGRAALNKLDVVLENATSEVIKQVKNIDNEFLSKVDSYVKEELRKAFQKNKEGLNIELAKKEELLKELNLRLAILEKSKKSLNYIK